MGVLLQKTLSILCQQDNYLGEMYRHSWISVRRGNCLTCSMVGVTLGIMGSFFLSKSSILLRLRLSNWCSVRHVPGRNEAPNNIMRRGVISAKITLTSPKTVPQSQFNSAGEGADTWHFPNISFCSYKHLKFTPRHNNICTPGNLNMIKLLHQLLLQHLTNPLIRKNLLYPRFVKRVIRSPSVIVYLGERKVHEPVQFDFGRGDEDGREGCGSIDETGEEVCFGGP